MAIDPPTAPPPAPPPALPTAPPFDPTTKLVPDSAPGVFDELLKLGDRRSGDGWHKATIKTIEAAFSKFSSRSPSLSDLASYLRARLIYEHLTLPYYMDPYLRYFRMRRYANTARTENKWIKALCDIYGQGKAENIVVVIGDWCMTGAKHFRQRRPAAYSRILQRLRAAGIAVFLVDEAFTSKRCSDCKSLDTVCSGDGIRDVLVGNGRSRWRRNDHSHGRVVCSECKRLWNRDVNASRNILHLATLLLTEGRRPEYLRKNENG